jgi:gag-polypeptide of LTR copia-type
MSSISKDTISGFTCIDQLKGDNWVAWKSCVTALLDLTDLLGVIDRLEKHPVPTNTERPTSMETLAMKAWDAKDWQIQSLLRLAISNAELVYLMGAQSACQMWEQLKEVKEPRGVLGVLSARRRLFRLMAQEGVPMIDHIAKFRQAQEALHAMGEPLTDRDFAMLLASSLLESWDTFTSSFLGAQGTMKTVLSSSEIITCIIEEDHRKREKAEQNEVANQALTFNHGKRPNRATSTSAAPCANCRKPGHTKEKCWAKGGGLEGILRHQTS